MPVVNYHSANGRLIGETTSGVRTDYMSDALGSVTGTLNASQAVVNTYRYKPYGELLAKTGSAADPAFMWNGTTQSRRTGLTFSDQYNRARHYGTRQGQWTTVDPLSSQHPSVSQGFYVYSLSSPSTWSDPTGLYVNSDIGQQACVSLQIPISIQPQISLGLEYCQWCYDTGCCPTEASSKCWSIAGNVTYTVVGLRWDKETDPVSQIRRTAESLLRLLLGGAVGIGQCMKPEKACVPKSRVGEFSLCARACGTIASLSCCGGFAVDHATSQTSLSWACSVSYGYCGLPSLTVRLKTSMKVCE